jgi:hypothetical protein
MGEGRRGAGAAAAREKRESVAKDPMVYRRTRHSIFSSSLVGFLRLVVLSSEFGTASSK